MTISYKKETLLEKHLHEFRDYLFKIQVERLNTNNARVYFLNKKTEEKIFIPKDITCFNLTSSQYENSLNIN
ncbi:29081_t:CDS:1, partial [Racocetra persica]